MNEIDHDYIEAFYSGGDQLHNGHTLDSGQAGVRLVGDIELTGTPEQLAELGQALVDRFRPQQYALVTGSFGEGHRFYGPTAEGETAADLRVLGIQAIGGDYDFVPLHPLVTPRVPADVNVGTRQARSGD